MSSAAPVHGRPVRPAAGHRTGDGIRSLVVRLLEDRRAPVVVLAVLLALTALWWLWLGRGLGLRGDDWDFAYYRVGWSADVLLAPHVDHLSLLGVLYIRAVWSTFGLDAFWPFRLINIGLLLAVLVTLFVYARGRVGAWGAVVLVALLAFVGPAAEDVLWAFQGQFMLALLFGMASLIALDRRDLRGDVAASALLALSLCSASYGIMFTVAVTVELLLGRRWRRLLVVIVPGVPYLLWRLHYHPGGSDGSGPLDVVKFVADSYAGTVAQLGGLPLPWGRVLGVAGLALIVAHLVLRRADDPARARRVAMIALPLVTWLLSGYARALTASPLSARYILPNVLFVLLLGASFLPRWRPTVTSSAVIGVLTVACVVTNMSIGKAASAGTRTVADDVRLELGAVVLARPAVAPDFALGAPAAFGNFTAAAFADAERRYGPAAVATEAEILRRSPADRAVADQTLIAAERFGFEAAGTARPASPAPTVEAAAARTSSADGGRCVRVVPEPGRGAAPTATFRLPASGVLVEPQGGSATLRALRWADGFPPAAIATTTQASAVVPARDHARATWEVQLTIDAATLVCGRVA